MLNKFKVLCLSMKQFIWILSSHRGLLWSSRSQSHLRHLLAIGSYALAKHLRKSPLSSPRIRVYIPRNPKRLRKYQDIDETQRTSKSGLLTPDCNICLNRIVNGIGNFTVVSPSAFWGRYATQIQKRKS